MQGWAAAALKQGAHLVPSLEAALEEISAGGLEQDVESVFIIGGGQACPAMKHSQGLDASP